MFPTRPSRPTRLPCVAVLLALLCLLCTLGGCSDEYLYPPSETLWIEEGTGRRPGTPIQPGTPTETPAGGSLIITPPTDFSHAEHLMKVDFLNVGDADSILLQLDDTVILMDTGESDDYATITAALDKSSVSTIDYLILTHFDNDHIGTAATLLKDDRYTVKTVYMPDYVRKSDLCRRLDDALKILKKQGATTVHRLTEAVSLALPYGTLWIHPTALYPAGETLGSDDSHTVEENNYSLMTTVTFGDIDLLLAGDAEQDRILEFMQAAPGQTYEVIKIPHHGGYDKALSDLLQASLGPLRYCVVSVGTPDLVEASLRTAMRAAAAADYYTYDGTIRLTTDGITMVIEQE